MNATKTIAIVHPNAIDPLNTHLITSLAHAGGIYRRQEVDRQSERPAHSVTNQYRGFRVRQHLVCHTAEHNCG